MQPFGLNDWVVEPSLNQLRRGDVVVRLEPKSMHVLCVLAERANETVSRAELTQIVWKGRVVVDEALFRVIGQLRQAFGDDPKSPAYIQTIRQRGYRLLAVPQLLESAPLPRLARVAPGQSWNHATTVALQRLISSSGLLWLGC